MDSFSASTIIIIGCFHAAGAVCALHALFYGRTAQSTIAWVMSLIAFPYLTVLLYGLFGRRKFHGYVLARRKGNGSVSNFIQKLEDFHQKFPMADRHQRSRVRAVEKLALLPFTHPNSCQLFDDVTDAFDQIFLDIDSAKNYILIQFYIVRDDDIGRELQKRLIQKANEGVKVNFLYDEIGCYQLPGRYLDDMLDAGVSVSSFNNSLRRRKRFQINFRNHRKLVIVDGHTLHTGGFNVGDEYLGKDKKFGYWRDTHCRITGPATQCAQLAFLEDWHWATDDVLNLNWTPKAAADGSDDSILMLPSGPADTEETCLLYFLHCINSAKERLWIASPYFVPGAEVMAALRLAALRGVDVRILLPEHPDHILVWLSSFAYIEESENCNIRFFRYQAGFMHQKSMIIDDGISSIGTANMDNRSFSLNFEITALIISEDFAKKVEAMFIADFKHSREVSPDEWQKRSIFFKLAVRAAKLLAPIQ